MTDDSEFNFQITAYSPETLPMERLARYLTELASLMGNASHVHFKGQRKGSTVVRAVIEQEASDSKALAASLSRATAPAIDVGVHSRERRQCRASTLKDPRCARGGNSVERR